MAYLVFARIAFEVVGGIIERKSQLPHSFTVVAIILLIIGLPIIVITAYVQDGIPSIGRSDPTLQVESKGDGQPPRRRLHKTFTWRNAMLGGVAAFTIWALVAAGWLMLAGDLLDNLDERKQQEAVQANGN